MNQEVWCFLVSANKYLDYRTVVAPDFMCKQNYMFVLAQAAGGKITEKDTAYYRKVINSKVGNLTLVFQVVEAMEKDIGISGENILQDSFGRVISLIEGIVFQGEVSATDIVVTLEDFQEVHQQIIEYYQKFWEQSSANPAYSSRPFRLSEKEKEYNGFQLFELDNYIAGIRLEKEPELVGDKQLPKKETSQGKLLKNASQSWEAKINIIRKFSKEINSIAISPNGQEIAIRYGQNQIVIKGVEEKILLSQGEFVGENAPPVVIDSSGKFLATAFIEEFFDDNIIKLWNLNTQESKKLGNHQNGSSNRVQAVVFSPDSEIVISGDNKGNIKLWDAKVGGEITTTNKPILKHDTQIRCMAVDNKNNILASGDKYGKIKIWEIGAIDLTEKRTISTNIRSLNKLVFSPNGEILATVGGYDYTIKLWNTKTGERYDRHERQHLAIVNSVAFSSDGKLIASGDNDGRIKIWTLKSKTAISSIYKEHTKAVTSVVFTPDSKLISGGKDGKLIMWERGAN
ncbi:MAG: WD40 repeat domain-containing protein [Trichodesmium sp. MAG_R03]|nr:WD40 repeat domain-containing protein [Trichodesmium sp. MAG_R03]